MRIENLCLQLNQMSPVMAGNDKEDKVLQYFCLQEVFKEKVPKIY